MSIVAGSSNRLNIMGITHRDKEAEYRIILDCKDEFITNSLLSEKINVPIICPHPLLIIIINGIPMVGANPSSGYHLLSCLDML